MIATLRRRLRPFKRGLRPIWIRLEPIVSPDAPRSIPTLVGRARDALADAARRRRGAPDSPIRPLRNHELVDLALSEPYYRPRRIYLSAAGAAARELIDRRRLRTALELGPHLRSLIVGADVMDVVERAELRAEGRRFIHDATSAPWPFADKAYDLFVALQVFEHLGDHQPDAFREVRRVARNAILSLPIDWVMGDPANCHHGLTHERALSWFAPVVPTRVLIGNPGHRKRLLYVFEDLPAPDEDRRPTGSAGAGFTEGRASGNARSRRRHPRSRAGPPRREASQAAAPRSAGRRSGRRGRRGGSGRLRRAGSARARPGGRRPRG